MKLTQWLIGLLLLICVALSSSVSAQLAWDPKEFMGVDEITPGMTGYGKTVFLGTKVEKFDIEVVGVLKKIDFGFDMILVRVKNGPVVDKKFQTVEGMSGSPIYINDRMIGAYAYGWDFQQEAIAGVTPIANMLECSEPGSVTPPLVGNLVPRDKVLRIGDHLITRVKIASCRTDAQALQAKADPTTMVLSPVATPLFVSGMSDAAMAPLQKLFAHYNMEAMPGPGEVDGPAPKLEPGSAVAVSLMEGDSNMSAVGTVTYVKGNTVLCFGHPFTETGIPGLNIQMGNINMPLSAAYVHGILSSAKSSFKLASPMGRVGSTTSDRQFAVAGELGKQASTVPISLFLSQPERNFTRRYSVDLIQIPELTPVLLYFFVLYNGAGQMGDPQLDQGSFTTRMILSTDKYGDIERNQIFAPMAAQQQIPLMDFYLLPDALMMNPYESVKLNKVFIDLKYTHVRNVASIDKITPDRATARPGETVNFTVKLHPFDKPVETRTVSVKIPESANENAMAVVIAGGTLDQACKPLIAPLPTPEEGTRGLIRWLTENNQPSTSLLTLQLFPTASYCYKGEMLEDLPSPVAEALRFNDAASGVIRTDEQGNGQASSSDLLRPTCSLHATDTPYVLTGAQISMINIDSDERTVQGLPRPGELEITPSPVLSSAQGSGTTTLEDASEENPAEKTTMGFNMGSLMTPVQRENFALLKDCLGMHPTQATLPALPNWRFSALVPALPLSISSLASDSGQDVGIEIQPKPATSADKGTKSDTASSESSAQSASDSDKSSDDSAGAENKHLLTPKVATWGLTGRKDFIRGIHLGTDVTSRGNLVIAPAVRSIYQTTEMVPWKVASVGKDIYLAGWNSDQVIHLDADNKSDVFFPKQEFKNVKTVTALTTDATGNILIATWPDQHVRLLAPDGAIQREWSLPGTMVWDLAVASDGQRYAACDGGMMYLLRDDEKAPVRVACSVPDKHVYALACGTHGEIYLATAPRGKVYRLNANGHLEAVYEARGMASCLAVDDAGNVYVGTSPLCRVYRISPDGTQQMILLGVGHLNHTVSAMKFIGDTLYVATGPTGGIYRISDPAGQNPEATIVFAREDLRTGNDEKAFLGAESVFVNALAVANDGQLLAAASSPGQLLKFEPRTQGTFLSPAMQAPAVSHWGQLDVLAKANAGQSISVESRTGNTALPDATWSDWQTVSKDSMIVSRPVISPAATYAQFRIRLFGNETGSPSLSYVKLYYRPANQAPVVRIEQPKPDIYWNGTKDIRWEASDPNGSELTYTVYTSRNNGKTWKQLMRPIETVKPVTEDKDSRKADGVKNKDEKNTDKDKGADKDKDKDALTNVADPDKLAQQAADKQREAEQKQKIDSEVHEKSIQWDTKSTPDGYYRIKVIATNKYASPTDPKSAECISDLFVVDNTPPTVSIPSKVTGWDALKRIEIKDNLTPILGGKFNIDGGPWIALEPENGIFDGPDVWALLISPDGEINLTPGDHKVTIQAVDAADNVLDRTITVTIPDKSAAVQAAVYLPPVTGGQKEGLAGAMLNSLK